MRITGINGRDSLQELTDIGLYANNMMFLIADMLEAALIESRDANLRAGYRLKQMDKHYVEAALYNLKKFRSHTRTCDEETQLMLGRDSDSWLQLMWMSVDRFALEPKKMHDIYLQIKAQPSVYKLDFAEDDEEPFDVE